MSSLIAFNGLGGSLLVTDGYGVSGVVAVTLREAVAAFLVNSGALSSIVGNRIYWTNASQVSVYPNVRVRVRERTWGHNLSGADGTSTATIEIVAQHQASFGGESTCVAIVEAIRNVFDGFRGSQSGVAILSSFLIDEEDDDDFPPDGSDQWIYRVPISYRVRHRVPTPTNVTQVNV
jgi:hypothetical protein